MSNLTITQSHTLDSQQLKDELEKLAVRMKEQYGVNSTWKNDQHIAISASGVNGEVTISDSQIAINLKFGMMMSMFAGKIEKDIKKYLAENFA